MSEKPEERLCYHCKKPGHFARECPDNKDRAKFPTAPSDRDSILRPPVLGDETGVKISMVKGRCYRQYVREQGGEAVDKGISAEATAMGVVFDEKSREFTLTMTEVRQEFYGFIIGPKGATMTALQQETGCTINVGDGAITLTALAEESVTDAKRRIEYLVEQNRERLAYTHFVSIPLDMASLKQPVTKLLGSIKSDHTTTAANIAPEMIQKPEKLHLTVLMMRLYSEDDKRKAATTLKRCKEMLHQVFTASDRLHLKGLACMNDDPTKVDVAYLKVAENETQKKLVDVIEHVSNEFILAGLCGSKEAANNKTLHATVVNSLWRRDHGEESGGKKTRVPFDMTALLNAHGDADLQAHKLMRMDLSERHAEKGETGYYKALESIPFP